MVLCEPLFLCFAIVYKLDYELKLLQIMTSLLGLIIQIINLFQFILIIYIIGTWLVNFNIINTSNRFVYSVMEAMYRLCEPSLNFVRRYLPAFGSIDLSPVVVYLGLWFLKSLLIEYWPR